MSDLLGIGASGVRAYSAALQVTGDNIANAQTAGYVRRTARLAEPAVGRDGFLYRAQIGADGVTVAGITRSSDPWLTEDARAAGGDAARASARLGWLEATERTIDDGGEGVGRSLTAVFNRADELAADPASGVRRTAFLQSAGDLAASVRRTADGLAAGADGVLQAAGLASDALNTDLASLTRVNDGLRRARDGGANQASLLDERDRLLDSIAAALPVTVTTEPRGAAVLTLPGGQTLLSGTTRGVISVTAAGDGRLAFAIDGATRAPTGGALAGLADAANHIADQRAALDGLAVTIGNQLNAQHNAGRDAAGNAGVALFTPGAGASAFVAVALSADKVAAADATSGNGNALAFGTLRGTGGGESQWATIAAQQAQAVANARAQESATGARRDGAAGARDALSAVDLDREAGDLIRYQQAYEASARVIQVARDTLQSILDAV
jgi:flagellar hook-associated protein 1